MAPQSLRVLTVAASKSLGTLADVAAALRVPADASVLEGKGKGVRVTAFQLASAPGFRGRQRPHGWGGKGGPSASAVSTSTPVGQATAMTVESYLTRLVLAGGAAGDSVGWQVKVLEDHLLPLDEQLADAA